MSEYAGDPLADLLDAFREGGERYIRLFAEDAFAVTVGGADGAPAYLSGRAEIREMSAAEGQSTEIQSKVVGRVDRGAISIVTHEAIVSTPDGTVTLVETVVFDRRPDGSFTVLHEHVSELP